MARKPFSSYASDMSRCLQCLPLTAAMICALGGCAGAPDEPALPSKPRAAKSEPLAYADWGDPLRTLPIGEEQRARVCERAGDDPVRDLFCKEEPPAIGSLRDLQVALGLDPQKLGGVTGSALSGHSTSLSARSVSAINPRVILLRLAVPPANVEFVTLSFNRGDQFSELAVLDRGDQEFRFYLVRFAQACNASEHGCTPGDLLSAAIETDWQDVTLYDESSLANTVFDCAPCHQPDAAAPKLLRMHELEAPWTHWFYLNTDGGKALIDDYTAAKGTESIAGLPYDSIEYSSPGGLQLLVGSRNYYQPNMFDSETIEREVHDSAAVSGGNQPFDNSVPGTSETWRAAYERAQRGEVIPVPYHDVKVTDEAKLEQRSAAYQAYLSGELDRSELPDLRDVFPDDAQRLAEMGIGTEPGSSGEAVLIQACSMCHNERLDQSQSRARFRADLQGVSREEKEVAIARLGLPANDAHAMPPARLRTLSREARERAIAALKR